jgi:hypothetical protein
MESKPKTKGSWGIRFLIILLSIIFGVLFYWLLGFITQDIGTMKGPGYSDVRDKYVDAAVRAHQETLEKETQNLSRKIQTLREQQGILRDSTNSLQNTMTQLLSLQKDSLQKNVEFSEQSKQTLAESQSAFLENQKKYEQYNQQITELTAQQRQKEDELAGIRETIKAKDQLVQKEYNQLYEKHQLKVAAIKLGFLVPVFLGVFWLFMRYRAGTYWPMVWAAFLAVFIKIALVIHEYFPSRWFKYIALIVMLGIVIRILIYLIRMIIAPKRELLIRQYQQDYDKHICPVCSKPIRIGPLRYLGGWKKKTPVFFGQDKEALAPQAYTCPSCGTNLYGKCGTCGGIRHTLLPYCEHCGTEMPASSK